MSTPVLAEKRCTKCGETKPLSEFHRHRGRKDGRQDRCKPCINEFVTQRRAWLRAQMGDDAWLEREREKVRRHRQRTGNARGKAWNLARSRAVTALIAAHRAEFDALHAREKYEAGLS